MNTHRVEQSRAAGLPGLRPYDAPHLPIHYRLGFSSYYASCLGPALRAWWGHQGLDHVVRSWGSSACSCSALL